MKIKLAVVGFITAVAAFAAETAPLTFNAVLTVGKEQRFGIATEGGARSGWIGLGGEFEGYKLSSFDQERQTLVFEREGKTYEVPLATGGVRTLDTKATLADAAEVMDRMKFEQMLSRMIDQQKDMLTNMSKQMMGPLGNQVSPDDFAALQRRIIDTLWSEMKPEDMKADLTRIYADLFTKEELRAMSEFYSTRAGEALIEKQPQMQQKMMEVMMPRMMRAMPQIQQMSQQFAAEQAKKINPPVPPPATK